MEDWLSVFAQSAGCLRGMVSHDPEKGPDIPDASHTSSLTFKFILIRTQHFISQMRVDNRQNFRERRDLY